MSWSIEVGFILDVAMNLNGFFTWEFSDWVSVSINLAWSSLRINVACSEGGLTWYVVGVVVRMSLWESFCSVSSWSWIKSGVTCWNPFLVVMGWWQIKCFTVKIIFGKNISALFGKGLFEKRISSNDGSVTLILGNDAVFLSNRFELNKYKIDESDVDEIH